VRFLEELPGEALRETQLRLTFGEQASATQGEQCRQVYRQLVG
jgi:hypothetical protein